MPGIHRRFLKQTPQGMYRRMDYREVGAGMLTVVRVLLAGAGAQLAEAVRTARESVASLTPRASVRRLAGTAVCRWPAPLQESR